MVELDKKQRLVSDKEDERKNTFEDKVEYHLFKITEIVEKHGAEMAFPTSTIHIENEALLGK